MTAGELAQALGGHRAGRDWMARCPSHRDRTASLAIRDGDVGPLVYCHAGCPQDDVVDKLKRLGLWSTRDERGPARTVPVHKPEREHSKVDDIARAKAILKGSHEITGTLAAVYLATREINERPECLRFHPALWHSKSRQNWPALAAPLRDIRTNEIVGVHRTFLARDGRGKAPIDPPRMVLGTLKGACIKLTPDEDVAEGLHIAEGIETALRCMQRDFRPMWAAVTAGGIKDFPVLSGIECLTVMADHDSAGLTAAQACAERWAAAGREAFIRWPDGLGRDYADGNAE